MSKNEIGHWIKISGRTKLVDTQPERATKSILDELRFVYTSDQHTNVEALNRKGILEHYRFQLDFCIPDFSKPLWVVVLEVNGILHDERKDRWESNLMLDAWVEGTEYQIDKVINFDAEWLKRKKDKSLAIKALKECFVSSERIVWKPA